MENLANSQSVRNSIKHVLNFLAQTTGLPYILVGGSSLLLHGSTRTTNDIDLLIPRHTIENFLAAQKTTLKAIEHNQIEKIDLLNEIVDRFDFDAIEPFSMDIEGIKVPQLDVMLGSKVLCYNLRPDGIEGEKKRASDLFDINWISRELSGRGWKVQKEVSDKMACGPYHMLLVVSSLHDKYGKESVELFESVGGREFEATWGIDTFAEQVELYELEMEEAEYSEEEVKLLQSRQKQNGTPD